MTAPIDEDSGASAGLCQASLLRGPCAESTWSQFLEKTCRYCRDSVCLGRWSLHDAAGNLWYSSLASRDATNATCRVGLMSAALVLAQVEGVIFWDHSHNAATVEAMFATSPASGSVNVSGGDLAPFPFDTAMWPALRMQVPALAARSCWGEGAAGEAAGLESKSSQEVERLASTRLAVGAGWRAPRPGPVLLPVPPVEALAEWCPVRLPPLQLARRCNARVRDSVTLGASPSAGSKLPAWRCPVSNHSGDGGKYDMPARSCREGYGMWGTQLARHLQCIAVVVAETLQMRPGSTVLDWGSGCGWMLSYFHLLYGALGYGIDMANMANTWSSRHSAGQFCLWASLGLDWVPDSSFDHIVSYWALYHVRPASKLCSVARQLVAKLKPGGRAWFGGNNPSLYIGIGFQAFSPAMWRKCLASLTRTRGMQLEIEFLRDRELFFVASDAVPEDAKAYLYLEPTYSALVTRRS